MLSKTAFDSFIEELYKLAALDPEEQKLFYEIAEKQREFDRMASSGKMSEAQKAAHRDNTERMRHFLNKRKDSSKDIPPWAKNPKAAPPKETYQAKSSRGGYTAGGPTDQEPFRPGYEDPFSGYDYGDSFHGKVPPAVEKVLKFIMKHPYKSTAGLGIAVGALSGRINELTQTKTQKKLRQQDAKEHGPASEFLVKHPVAGNAALGAVTFPAALKAMEYGMRGKPGKALLMGLAPAMGLSLADVMLKDLKKKPSKPKSGPRVSKPKKAA